MNQAEAQIQLHPAAEWATQTHFTPVDVDCTTTVVLKILDNKCKMLPGEKLAIMAIYDVVRPLPGNIFSEDDHDAIACARGAQQAGEEILKKIHALRVYAEAQIPKPVMKAYKAVLRDGLFG